MNEDQPVQPQTTIDDVDVTARIKWLQDRLAGWRPSTIGRKRYENELWRLMRGADDGRQKHPKRMKWVRAESRDEHECERLGWKPIAQETRMDHSLWCLWANMEDHPHAE